MDSQPPNARETEQRDLALKVIKMARESTQAMCERIQARAEQLRAAGDVPAQELWRALLPELSELRKVVDSTIASLAFGAGGSGGMSNPQE
jgi:hypothetical protein